MLPKPASIDAYIASFPPEVQAILEKIRSTIRSAAPAAQETISYNIPAFTQNGTLVYFAAFKISKASRQTRRLEVSSLTTSLWLAQSAPLPPDSPRPAY
jgi:hypothetical protein